MSILRLSKLASAATEFLHTEERYLGPGLPSRKRSDLPTVKKPQAWEFSAHPHMAERAGPHIDLRLGDPSTGIAHSFVIPKAEMPEPGKMVKVIPTYDHTIPYMDFSGEVTSEYGRGIVIPGRREKAEVYHADPGSDKGTKVRFNLYEGRQPEEYSIRSDGDGGWFLHNKTLTRERRPDIPDYKPAYKEIDLDQVDVGDLRQIMMPKLDGAHALIDLQAGRSPRVFSYRTAKKAETGLIEHTHKMPALLEKKVPKELDGTILRAELLGLDEDGNAIPAERIGGILNSKVWESRKKQGEGRVQLSAFPFSVVRYRGRNMEEAPFNEKMKVLKKVEEKLPLTLPPVAESPEEKVELLNAIKTGKYGLTDEGVVLVDRDHYAAPVKAKKLPDYDVYVRGIIPAKKKGGGEHERAGSVQYSWTKDGPIVGQVGDFKHDEAREMVQHPERYVGKVAKMRARKVFDGGALFQPRFQEWHLDKGDIEKSAFLSELAKISSGKEISGIRPEVQLYGHQKRAIERVGHHDGNLLLSHGTGSGKTLTALAAFEKMRDEGKATRALVVTPASLRVNFLDNGVKKFTDGRGAMFGNSQEVGDGVARSVDNPDPGARYHVVSYEMFRKDPERYIKSSGADTVIYDELHRIRNEEGATYKALKDARPFHKNFLGLTGSIMNNTPGDMVPLVDAMTNGQHHLGTKTNFERRFVKEDSKGGKSITRPFMVRTLLRPFVDHFETKDMDDERMPKKIVEDVKVMMSPHQTILYRHVMDKLDPITALKVRFGASKLKSRDINNIFSRIIQGRQVSNAIHTIDLDTPLEESAEKTPKVKTLLDDVEDHLKETPDGQVVVHSNLIHGGVDVLKAGLQKRGIEPAIFIGKGQPGVSEKSRQEGVGEFNQGKKKVIVISAAGGEGLDLKNATMFASLDGHFNPEKIQQAEARAIRAGGLAHRPPEQRKVIVKRYMSVVPRSVSRTALDTLSLISPASMLKRLTDPSAPLLYNPFKRERSPDEWMYDIANRKDVLNEAFRHQLKTASADEWVDVDEALYDAGHSLEKVANLVSFLDEMEKLSSFETAQQIPFQPYKRVKSDSHIMDAYWKEFGDRVEEMPDPYVAELPSQKDREKEQLYITSLKKYYQEAPKGSGEPLKGVKTDSDVWKNALKGGALAGGILFPAMVAPPLVRGLKGFAAITGAGLLAGLGASALSTRKNVYFTTQKSRARKRSKLGDEQLRALLRGLSVVQEVVKRQEHFIDAK